MKKLLALLTLLLPLTAAQAPVYSVVGGRLLCGMYLRAAGQVQTWCWAGSVVTALWISGEVCGSSPAQHQVCTWPAARKYIPHSSRPPTTE